MEGRQRSEVLLDVLELDELVHDGVDRQTTGAVDLQLLGDITAVCDDRVRREVELTCYLLVRHALDHADDDFTFARGERLRVGGERARRRLTL